MAVFKGRAKCIPKDRDAIFLPFQTAWIKDESRLKLMEKSRQSRIEDYISNKESDLQTSTHPPYLIK